jgi:hypothetical protein
VVILVLKFLPFATDQVDVYTPLAQIIQKQVYPQGARVKPVSFWTDSPGEENHSAHAQNHSYTLTYEKI